MEREAFDGVHYEAMEDGMKVDEEAVMREIIEYALDDVVFEIIGDHIGMTFRQRERATDRMIERIKEKFVFEGAKVSSLKATNSCNAICTTSRECNPDNP